MKIMVWCDIEGVSGLDDVSQIASSFGTSYSQGRELQTAEVNAAVRGLRAAGAGEIHVLDGHGAGGNVIAERLEPGVQLLGGAAVLLGMMRTGALASYDALVLLGQHAMAGTRDGFLSHSNTSFTALRLNGAWAGEIAEAASILGHYGVPTILVAGDDAAVREAHDLLPGVRGVAVKTARGRQHCDLLPLQQAHAQIEQAAAEALRHLDSFAPYRPATPVEVEITFARPELGGTVPLLPRSRPTGERSVAYTAADLPEAMMFYFSAVNMIAAALNGLLLERLWQVEGVAQAAADFDRDIYARWSGEEPPFEVVKH